MWRWNVRKNSKGFTLIETLAVSIMIGIVAAIAAPSLFGLLSRYRVNEGLSQIEGAIKEAQRQAIRQGRSCSVEIDTTNNIISGNPSNCLLNEREIADSIDIETNLLGTPPSIKFSYNGSTSKAGKIVVSSSGTNLKKCFAISIGLGITRTGEYEPDPSKPNDLSEGECKSSNN